MKQKPMTLGEYDTTLHKLVSLLHKQIIMNEKTKARKTWENLQWCLASVSEFIDELK